VDAVDRVEDRDVGDRQGAGGTRRVGAGGADRIQGRLVPESDLVGARGGRRQQGAGR
jgi:hypothetical protein